MAQELEAARWIADGGRLVGIGGTVRNLAAAAQLAAGLPSYGIQGFRITRTALAALIEDFAEQTPAERAKVAGIKSERKLGNGKKEVVFKDTIRMSTYLLAFIIAECHRTVDAGTPLRVVHVRHARATGWMKDRANAKQFCSYYGIRIWR